MPIRSKKSKKTSRMDQQGARSRAERRRCDAMRLAARAHLGSQLVANVNVPVRLAAWSRASFSWLRTILNEGDAEAETERKRQEERSRRRCGGKNRSRRLASSDDLQNEPRRQRAATMAGPLSLPLSRERETASTLERRRAARNSSTRRFFAPPPIGSLAATSSAAALCAGLRALRSNSDPALSLGHASRPSEFSPNFLAGFAAPSAAAQVISPAPSRKKKATETQRRTGVHLPTSAC